MNVAVFGANGRMGKATCGAAESKGHSVWKIDRNYSLAPLERVDVCIDFSLADATDEVCRFCRKYRCPLVTGVTGRNDAQEAMLKELEQCVPVLAKSNFSRGIAVLNEICAIVAERLKNWDAEIVEMHRNGKLDAPSGTAVSLAATVTQAKGSFSSASVHSLRAGSCFGSHAVIFATEGERLTFLHQAESVNTFARGAVEEAERLAGRV